MSPPLFFLCCNRISLWEYLVSRSSKFACSASRQAESVVTDSEFVFSSDI